MIMVGGAHCSMNIGTSQREYVGWFMKMAKMGFVGFGVGEA